MKTMLDIKGFLLEAVSNKISKKQTVAKQRISLVQDVLDKKELSNEEELKQISKKKK